MSSVLSLPGSAVRDFRKGSQIGGDNIAEPGQGCTSSETWRVDTGDTLAFVNAIFGGPEVVGGWGGSIVRVIPLRHPEFPALLATSFTSDTKGFTDNSQFIAGPMTGFWQYRFITVNFKTRPFLLTGQDAFMTQARSPEQRQIPSGASNFKLNGNAPTFDPTDEINGESWTFTTHQLPSLDQDVYDKVRNCVNNGVFYGRPIGTVLYRGPSISETVTVTGQLTYEVTHNFSYSEVPWNKYYIGSVLYDMYRADGSTYKYLLADLTTIFRV
jgi:hypothetical protein